MFKILRKKLIIFDIFSGYGAEFLIFSLLIELVV
jgi:hypothetical protein